MEKCSESIGTNLTLCFFDALFINFQPHIIDSLFANNNTLLIEMNLIVGSKPAMPGIAQIVKSTFFSTFFK